MSSRDTAWWDAVVVKNIRILQRRSTWKNNTALHPRIDQNWFRLIFMILCPLGTCTAVNHLREVAFGSSNENELFSVAPNFAVDSVYLQLRLLSLLVDNARVSLYTYN